MRDRNVCANRNYLRGAWIETDAADAVCLSARDAVLNVERGRRLDPAAAALDLDVARVGLLVRGSRRSGSSFSSSLSRNASPLDTAAASIVSMAVPPRWGGVARLYCFFISLLLLSYTPCRTMIVSSATLRASAPLDHLTPVSSTQLPASFAAPRSPTFAPAGLVPLTTFVRT